MLLLSASLLGLRTVMRNCAFRSVNRILIGNGAQLRIRMSIFPQKSIYPSGQWRNASGGKNLPFEDEIKVPNNVLLFRYENPRFFRMLVFFAVAQFAFWIYLSCFTFANLRDVSKLHQEAELIAALAPGEHPRALAWWRAINLGENKYRNGISLLCFSLGYFIVAGCWMYSARTVRSLTLLKPGSHIQLTTYGPFWGKNALTVPLEQVTCQTGPKGRKKLVNSKRKHPGKPLETKSVPKRAKEELHPQESTDEEEMVEIEEQSIVMQLLSTFDGNTAVKKRLQAIDSDEESDSTAESENEDDSESFNSSDDHPHSGNEPDQDTEEDSGKSDEDDYKFDVKGPLETNETDDYFTKHFEVLLPNTFVENLLSSTVAPKNHKLKWPQLGSIQFTCHSDCSSKKIEKPHLTKTVWESASVLPMLVDGFCNWNKQFMAANQTTLTPFQEELFCLMSTYRDVYFSNRTFGNCEEIRSMYCLHAMNHVLKSARCIKRNDGLLHGKMFHGTLDNMDDEEMETYRDQGLTRPKVLIVVPFRQSVRRIIDVMSKVYPFSDKGNVMSINRFVSEFGEKAKSEKKKPKKGRPLDHQQTFAGNTDDNFRIGLTFTRKSIKLYTKFYASDMIIASPLGLRTIIGAPGEKDRDYDFLSSIEMVILDQTEVFLMQNWEHVTHLAEYLNAQPVESHDVDFTRVRNWVINGWAKFYRQNLIFSSVACPEINSLFNRKCCNYAGKARIGGTFIGGSIQQVVLQLRQVFLRYEAPKCPSDDPDSRFNAFMSSVLPQVKSSQSPHHIMIFVPSYFDFVRLRNRFKREDASFVQICEYTPDNKMARARDMFFHLEREMMIYTERAHFYRRTRIKGMIHVVFYQLPVFAHFYSEICNNLNLCRRKFANDVTCTVLYSRLDGQRLAGVVGTDRATRMISSDKTVHMFVTGDVD